MTDLLKAAVWYAKHQIPVFPCHGMLDGACTCGKTDCDSPGKHPATEHGFKDATTDIGILERWWKKNPNYNVAMATGAPSGVTVIDVDPRNGGDESLEALVGKYGPLPSTAEAITGGGGRHIVIKYVPGVKKKELAPGLDLKSDNGLIVIAPSVHRSGRRYEWDGLAGARALLQPASAPQWLIDLLTTPTNTNGAGQQPIDPKITAERNKKLTSIGGTLRRRGFAEAEIFTTLWAVNLNRCEPPLSESEVHKIAASVCRYPAGNIGGGNSFHYDDDPGSEHADGGPNIFERLTPYPTPLGPEAYHGIAGKFVRLVEPHTEADPNFLLISFLIHAGNIFGRDAWVWAGGDKHHTNLFGCAVGPTSTGRKGSAAGPIRMFFEQIDDDWVKAISSGLSSGEGLIWAVRNPIYRREWVSKGRGIPKVLEDVCVDQGVADKRIVIMQSEFYSALQAMKRQGCTLSATMRDAWDKGDLRTMVKNSPARANGAHISIIANVTRDELLRGMLSEEMDNGFANRILWICSQRSKELPEGGELWQVDFDPLRKEFNRINGPIKGAIGRDPEAADIWGYDDCPGGAYRHLTRDRGGMFGAVCARAAAQVLRLSLIYAILDGSREIGREQLDAALEVWRYCEESAAYIFGDATGDPTADAILGALRQAGAAGMTRWELMDHFKRHKPSAELNRALMVLHKAGRARFEREKTEGRPTERWWVIDPTSEAR